MSEVNHQASDHSDDGQRSSPRKRKHVGVTGRGNDDSHDHQILNKKSGVGHGSSGSSNSSSSESITGSRSSNEKVSIDKRRRIDKTTPMKSSQSQNQLFSVRLKKWLNKWEVPRKTLHTSIGFITLHQWLKGTASPIKVSSGLAKALVIIVSADVLRFRSTRFARFYESLLGFLMRPSEKHNWNGVIFYLIGVITSLSTLPLDISVLSILILSWVDTAASIIGRLYGSETNRLPSPPFARRKSWAGFLGALTIGTTTAFTFWSTWASQGLSGPEGYSWQGVASRPISQVSQSRDLFDQTLFSSIARSVRFSTPRSSLGLGSLSFACGLVAALAESFDLFGWDDNLVLPVLSGWGIWGLMKIFG